MRVTIRADASGEMGGGHVMRCLTLADALTEHGAHCTFVCAQITAPIEKRVRDQGHGLVRIASSPLSSAPPADAEPFGAAEQGADAEQLLSVTDPADWLIVDHYGLDHSWEAAVRPKAGRILAFDDLANRRHNCDLLLDQTYGRHAEDYEPLVPPACRLLMGPRHAPLRPEFPRLREAALARRAKAPTRRLLITLGSTDVGGISAEVLREALAAQLEIDIDVVIGSTAPSRGEIETLAMGRDVTVHVDSRDMAGLMTEADLAVGAAGATSWERCCLGLPSLALVLAENQRLIARQLEEAGAHQIVTVENLGEALSGLVGDPKRRLDMARRASQVTDGRGATRLCGAMLAMTEEGEKRV